MEYYTCTAFPNKNFKNLDNLIEKTKQKILNYVTDPNKCRTKISALKKIYPSKDFVSIYDSNIKFDKNFYNNCLDKESVIERDKNLTTCSILEGCFYQFPLNTEKTDELYRKHKEPYFRIYHLCHGKRIVIRLYYNLYKNDYKNEIIKVNQSKQFTIAVHSIDDLIFEDE